MKTNTKSQILEIIKKNRTLSYQSIYNNDNDAVALLHLAMQRKDHLKRNN
jgi:hypothetical protein